MEEELKDTKSKLSIITQKFANSKKEVTELKKANKELYSEVMSLQSNIRQMVPGFSNTGSSFPLFTELINEVSEFLKCDCQD
jgi:FtsZ-binding cell division protein ZapB